MIASELILRAMRMAGVLEAEETPSSAEQVDALAAFNMLMHQWALDGIPLGWSDLAWGDTIIVPDEYIRAMQYNTAVEMCVQFKEPVSMELAAIAANTKSDLIEDNVSVPDVDTEIAYLGINSYNVITG